MIFDALDGGLLIRIRIEEFADRIGHFDEFFYMH
jgi:hypothetical protein